MNQVMYESPHLHGGAQLPSQPSMVMVEVGDMAGNLVRTPHIFGGMTPLLDVASRIAAGLDPRTFLRPEEAWDSDGIESEAMLTALDRAVGMATIYAHKLVKHCAAITQAEIEHAQEQARKAAAQQNGRNGKRIEMA